MVDFNLCVAVFDIKLGINQIGDWNFSNTCTSLFCRKRFGEKRKRVSNLADCQQFFVDKL